VQKGHPEAKFKDIHGMVWPNLRAIVSPWESWQRSIWTWFSKLEQEAGAL
jgi:hypothetical protein